MKYDLESINKRKENAKLIKKVLEIIAIILIYNIILTTITADKHTSFINLLGYKSYIIKTDSMEPTININDIVIIKKVPEEKIENYDVITFIQKGKTITHRITDIDTEDEEKKYTTKGDNNNIEDTFKVSYKDIEGKMVLTIPYLGTIVEILENKIVFLVVLLIILISIFFVIQKQEKREIRREKKKIEKARERE